MYSLIKWAVTLELKSVQYWCWFYGSDATKSSVNNTISNINLFAADVFLIYLLEKRENKMAVTAYSVFYDYDFGPLLRNVAIMNIGSVDPNFTGSRALAGPGNAQPTIGSGNIWYTSGNFITKQSRQTSSRTTFWSFYL
jgi:hypothetical protein